MSADAFISELEQRVQALAAKRHDSAGIDELAETVTSILGELAKYIDNAKAEIAALCLADIRDTHLPAATDQLDAIVASTEEATSTILEATEIIAAKANELDEPEITEQVTRIFEASSFQDLTGQRTSKVIATLKHVEEHIGRLLRVFGDETDGKCHTKAERDTNPTSPKGVPLDGPELPGAGNKQEDIDALLASFE